MRKKHLNCTRKVLLWVLGTRKLYINLVSSSLIFFSLYCTSCLPLLLKGIMKYKGIGCEQSKQAAFEYFTKSAALSYTPAVFALGTCSFFFIFVYYSLSLSLCVSFSFILFTFRFRKDVRKRLPVWEKSKISVWVLPYSCESKPHESSDPRRYFFWLYYLFFVFFFVFFICFFIFVSFFACFSFNSRFVSFYESFCSALLPSGIWMCCEPRAISFLESKGCGKYANI